MALFCEYCGYEQEDSEAEVCENCGDENLHHVEDTESYDVLEDP